MSYEKRNVQPMERVDEMRVERGKHYNSCKWGEQNVHSNK